MKFDLLVLDISGVNIDPPSDLALSYINTRYIKISFSKVYTRDKQSGVLTLTEELAMFLKKITIYIEGHASDFDISNSGEATVDGILCTNEELRELLRNQNNTYRTNVCIRKDIILDLGDTKKVNKILIQTGSMLPHLKYEYLYNVSYSRDAIKYNIVYTHNPLDITPNVYLEQIKRIKYTDKLVDRRFLST